MQSIQNKIDKFIQQGNQAFSEENRVIEALTKYSRAYELYNYLDRKYNVQIHEVLVRIAICWMFWVIMSWPMKIYAKL